MLPHWCGHTPVVHSSWKTCVLACCVRSPPSFRCASSKTAFTHIHPCLKAQESSCSRRPWVLPTIHIHFILPVPTLSSSHTPAGLWCLLRGVSVNYGALASPPAEQRRPGSSVLPHEGAEYDRGTQNPLTACTPQPVHGSRVSPIVGGGRLPNAFWMAQHLAAICILIGTAVIAGRVTHAATLSPCLFL